MICGQFTSSGIQPVGKKPPRVQGKRGKFIRAESGADGGVRAAHVGELTWARTGTEREYGPQRVACWVCWEHEAVPGLLDKSEKEGK